MADTASISPSSDFIEGFVDFCYKQGLSLDETDSAFRKHANTMFLAKPEVYEGFREGLQHGHGLSKSALARFLSPDILALAVDCRIKYASDVLSTVMREEMGLPEPSWDTVDPELQKTASAIGEQLAAFRSIPLQQQLLIAALVGAGIGGIKRMFLPNESDQANQRGLANRAIRGAARGGATGAGAAAGASLAGPKNLGGAALGAGAGAVAGNQLAGLVTG